MADTVQTQVVKDTGLRYEVLLTNVSDSTGESGVVKVDLSALTHGMTALPPSRLDLEELEATVLGFDGVRIYWDHTVDVNIAVLGQGRSQFKYKKYYKDTGTGGTGDVCVSTLGTATAGDTYTIRMRFRKRQ